MSRRATSAAQNPSSSQFIDSNFHPGFINLGNTCFLNSVLQAASATQSLKHLYHPEDFLDDSASDLLRGRTDQVTAGQSAAELSDEAAFAQLVEQLSVRSKSPVLQLVDEERGRLRSYPASRRASTVADYSNAPSLLARSEEATTVDSTISSNRSSIDIKGYEPSSNDLPLNTAFRHILEKTWTSEEKKVASTSKANHRKASAINPKRLLTIMSSKYDQYGDYAQQDGHELLRHLLDSLRMEELDVIKKIRPPSPNKSKKRDRTHSNAIQVRKSREEKLQPFVDNLFCGKLLSCVVCEGCRHVSHTYEDFYDISLSLRGDTDAKSAVKRDRMRSMADRWKRATTSKTVGNGLSNRPATNSMTSLRDDLVGSVSDTEDVDQKTKHHLTRNMGADIIRPKSAAAGQNPAVVDANSKASAKTFMMKSLQPETGQSVVADMEKMSLQSEEKKANHGGAAALLRAVSTRSRSKTRGATSSSRGPSPINPINEEIHQFVDKEKAASHHHLLRHDSKPKQSKHAAYLAKLLSEAPQQPTLAPTNALLWGRRTPVPTSSDQPSDSNRKVSEGIDIESQQAGTGLVRALHQFTSVEVLDGANSFACKRCWRQLNPPSTEEKQRLRSRRLRRGREEDESERSSDDDPSSTEEEKEQNEQIVADPISPQSSSESKPSRPAVNPHIDWNKTVRPYTMDQQIVPSIEKTSPVSPNSKNDQPNSNNKGEPTSSPSRAPLLKAPKALTASSKGLTLGESLCSASSDEELSDGAEDGIEIKRTTSVVTFEDQQSKETSSRSSLPMASKPKPVINKRSTHSLQRRALKRFLIANTPRVLVFHFKRFQASSRGFSSYSFSSSFKKIDDYVSFPEYLDVKPWLAPPREDYSQSGQLKKSSDVRALAKAQLEEGHEQDKGHGKWGWKHRHTAKEREAEQLDADTQTKYKLYAVVVHQGSMSGGHYTAYVLSDQIVEGSRSRVTSGTQSHTPTAHATPSTPGLSKESNKKSPYLVNGESGKSISNDASLRSSLSLTSLNSSSGVGAVSNGNTSDAVTSSSSMPNPTDTTCKAIPIASKTSEVPPDKSHSAPTAAPAMMQSDSSNGAAGPARMTEKKKDNRRWIFCSDTVIRGATIEEVLKAQAYMLFYERDEA